MSAHTPSPVIDTIAHVWECASPDRPFARPSDHLGPPRSPTELLALMDEAGVDEVWQVTPSNMGWDNRYSFEVAARHPDRVRVVALVDPRRSDVHDAIATLREEPGFAAVRVNLLRAPGFADGDLRSFWTAASDLGVPVALLVPGHLRELAQVAVEHPNLRIVVDHLGAAWGADDPFEAWADLSSLASLANVMVRASALAELTQDRPPFARAHEVLERLCDLVGVERVLWGSNYPAVLHRCTYGDTVDMVRQAPFLTPVQAAMILGGNAARELGTATARQGTVVP